LECGKWVWWPPNSVDDQKKYEKIAYGEKGYEDKIDVEKNMTDFDMSL